VKIGSDFGLQSNERAHEGDELRIYSLGARSSMVTDSAIESSAGDELRIYSLGARSSMVTDSAIESR